MAAKDTADTVTINTPVDKFNGTVAGVAFKDGVGETANPVAIAYFRRHGYTVDGETPEQPEPTPPPDVREPVRVGTPLEDAAATGGAPSDEEIAEMAADLADDHNRDELDGQATAAGLDPADYRTKADVAAAIIRARTGNA
jgi:hypothetical protein